MQWCVLGEYQCSQHNFCNVVLFSVLSSDDDADDGDMGEGATATTVLPDVSSDEEMDKPRREPREWVVFLIPRSRIYQHIGGSYMSLLLTSPRAMSLTCAFNVLMWSTFRLFCFQYFPYH